MKNIILNFDGTCNDPEHAGDFFEDSSISNILKLHAFFGGKLSPLNEKNNIAFIIVVLALEVIGFRKNLTLFLHHLKVI